MTKRWARWILVAPAVVLFASAALACGNDEAAENKDPKEAKAVVAKSGSKGCDMPCCARDRGGAEAKTQAAAKKGHAKKKAGAVAEVAPPTADTVPEAAKPAPASSGTQR